MMIRAGHVVAVLALLATGCGSDARDGGPAYGPTTSATAAPSPTTEAPETSTPAETTDAAPTGTTITTGDSEFGPMLFDANDQAIYIWELEPTSEATCYGDCAAKWPPVLTDGEPVASGKVRQRLLGTTERRDGSRQVTYNDHPLYFYADEPPGAVECHDISTHGGLWWVIQPDGDRAA